MGRVFWEQVRYGQDVYEDAGGYDRRCWCAAFGLSFRAPTLTYSGYMAAGNNPVFLGLELAAGGDMPAL
ncbi:hypothetical protein ABIB85_008260 [Bradyrhizobium sp. JR1.5]